MELPSWRELSWECLRPCVNKPVGSWECTTSHISISVHLKVTFLSTMENRIRIIITTGRNIISNVRDGLSWCSNSEWKRSWWHLSRTSWKNVVPARLMSLCSVLLFITVLIQCFCLYVLFIAGDGTNAPSLHCFQTVPYKRIRYKEVLQYYEMKAKIDEWSEEHCAKRKRLIESNKSQCQRLLIERFINIDRFKWKIHISVGVRVNPESATRPASAITLPPTPLDTNQRW